MLNFYKVTLEAIFDGDESSALVETIGVMAPNGSAAVEAGLHFWITDELKDATVTLKGLLEGPRVDLICDDAPEAALTTRQVAIRSPKKNAHEATKSGLAHCGESGRR